LLSCLVSRGLYLPRGTRKHSSETVRDLIEFDIAKRMQCKDNFAQGFYAYVPYFSEVQYADISNLFGV